MAMMNNLVGKRVFNNSSFAPNRGAVNPQGYIERGLAQRASVANPNINTQKQGPFGGVSTWGNDNQSDTRAGVAAQALAATNPNPVAAAQVAPTPTAAPTISSPVGQSQPAAGTPFSAAASDYKMPVVDIDAVGKLNLPFQYKYEAAALDQQSKANSALLDQRTKDEANTLAFHKALDSAGDEYNDVKLDTLNNAAARGTAFSSGYGKKVSQNAAAFNSKTGELESANTHNESGRVLSQTQILAQLNDFLKQNSLDAAQSLDAEAGTLGLSAQQIKSGKGLKGAISAIQQQAAKAQAESGVIHDRTGEYLNRLYADDSSKFASAGSENSALIQALLGTLTGNTNSNVNAVDAEQARLGLSAVGSQAVRDSGTRNLQYANEQGTADTGILNAFTSGQTAMNPKFDALNKGSREEAIRSILAAQNKDIGSTKSYYTQQSAFKPYKSNFTPYASTAKAPTAQKVKVPKVPEGTNWALQWLQNSLNGKSKTSKKTKSLTKLMYPWS